MGIDGGNCFLMRAEAPAGLAKSGQKTDANNVKAAAIAERSEVITTSDREIAPSILASLTGAPAVAERELVAA